MSTSTTPVAGDRIMRLPEFRQRLGGVAVSTVYAAMKDGRLPHSVPITGSRAVGWRESDIVAFIATRAPKSDPGNGDGTAGSPA